MVYLLQSSCLVLILVIFYYIFLKNETFFTAIRYYFLIGLLIILLLPFVEIPIYTKQEAINFNQLKMVNNTAISTSLENSINWISIITNIYFLGIIIFSTKFITQLVSLLKLIFTNKSVKKNNIFYIQTTKNISPFSFFNVIVYNSNQFTQDELEQIIAHEKIHVKHAHSIDTLLSHFLTIFLWFNPFSWYYKKMVIQNLEFLTDAKVIKSTTNHELYKFTLIKTYTQKIGISITNNFYNSLIKKRIIMLHKKASQKKMHWKFSLLIPVLALFISIFNTKVIAQENNTKETTQNQITIVVDKNSTDESLNKISKIFEKTNNIELKFYDIKRNTTHEITAIKITAKGTNTQSKFENSGTKSIQPIIISFNSESNELSIGNVSTKNNVYRFTIDKNAEQQSKESLFFKENGDEKTWVVKKKNDTIANKEHNIIWISESDNASEYNDIHPKKNTSKNTIIIKSDGNSLNHWYEVKKNDQNISSDKNEEPLYIVDGKEVSSESIKNILPNTIDSINVLKGNNAINKYGEKGKNGVIEITLIKK